MCGVRSITFGPTENYILHCVTSASANIWTNKIILRLVADILETCWHFQGLLQTTQLSATATNAIRFLANLTGVSNLFLLQMQFINAAKCITTLHLPGIRILFFSVNEVINEFCYISFVCLMTAPLPLSKSKLLCSPLKGVANFCLFSTKAVICTNLTVDIINYSASKPAEKVLICISHEFFFFS